MVALYDGGGFNFSPPGNWAVSVDSAAAASGNTAIVTAGENELVRVFSVAVNEVGGPTTPDCVIRIILPLGITPTVSAILAILGTAQVPPEFIRTLVLPPGAILDGFHFNGGAGTVVRYGAYINRMPLGAVPAL